MMQNSYIATCWAREKNSETKFSSQTKTFIRAENGSYNLYQAENERFWYSFSLIEKYFMGVKIVLEVVSWLLIFFTTKLLPLIRSKAGEDLN